MIESNAAEAECRFAHQSAISHEHEVGFEGHGDAGPCVDPAPNVDVHSARDVAPCVLPRAAQVDDPRAGFGALRYVSSAERRRHLIGPVDRRRPGPVQVHVEGEVLGRDRESRDDLGDEGRAALDFQVRVGRTFVADGGDGIGGEVRATERARAVGRKDFGARGEPLEALHGLEGASGEDAWRDLTADQIRAPDPSDEQRVAGERVGRVRRDVRNVHERGHRVERVSGRCPELELDVAQLVRVTVLESLMVEE